MASYTFSSASEEATAQTYSGPVQHQPHLQQQQEHDAIQEQQVPLMSEKPNENTDAPCSPPVPWDSIPLEPPPPPPPASMTWPQTLALWLPEMAAGLLMLVSIVAIVATLAPHAGRPQPDWPFSISLNTLLSIYAFVLEGGLAYVLAACISQQQWLWLAGRPRPLQDLVSFSDAGSHALGALQWLGTHLLLLRLRPSSSGRGVQGAAAEGAGRWTAWAALLVVLSVAIDPFVQQLIQFTSCTTVLAVGAATIPRTNYFAGTGLHLGAATVVLAPALQSAFNEGIYNRRSQPAFACATGNCTFAGTYSSVGYCSRCDDRSEALVVNTTCVLSDADPDDTCDDPWLWQQYTELPGAGIAMNWSASLVNGDRSVFVAGVPDTGTVLLLQGATYYTARRVDPVTGHPLSGCDDAATNDTWRCRGYGAVQCLLAPCVQTYRADVANGVLTETVVDGPGGASFPADTTAAWGLNTTSWTMATIDTRCLTAAEMDHLAHAGYANVSAINASAQHWLPYRDAIPDALLRPDASDTSGTAGAETAFLAGLLDRRCLYVFDFFTQNSLWYLFMRDVFSGSVTATLNDNSNNIAFTRGPQSLVTLYAYGTVTADSLRDAFQGVADAVSVYMRGNGQAHWSEPARGTVRHYATCLEVHWPWIALPATLAAAALVLLGATIVAARQGRVPLWKGSRLAPVFHGPVGAAAAAATPGSGGRGGNGGHGGNGGAQALRSVDGMEQAARQILVKLERSQTGTAAAAGGEDFRLEIQQHGKPE